MGCGAAVRVAHGVRSGANVGDGVTEPEADATTEPEPPRSGLRNPAAAVRGVGAAALAIEALALLMAIVPLAKLGGPHAPAAVGAAVGLAVLSGVLAGLLRHRWAWYAGIALQVVLFACGLLHVALAVLGLLFGAVWGYVLSVRRTVLGQGGSRGVSRSSRADH
jgi:hypothetical protein